MHALHFLNHYYPVPGGTTMRVSNMLASKENTHTLVTVMPRPADCPNSQWPIPCAETYGHIRVERVDVASAHSLGMQVPFLRDHVIGRLLYARSIREAKDIIHVHNPLGCVLAGLLSGKHRDLPLVYEAHGVMRDSEHRPRLFGPVTPLNRLAWTLPGRFAMRYEKLILQRADRIIVQTESVRRRLDELYGLGGTPVDVIRNGVDADRFNPSHFRCFRNEMRERHKWNDRLIILYAGYIDDVNGIMFLLSLLPAIPEQLRKRIRFVLIGRGPQQDALKHAARDYPDIIEFPGVVEPDKVGHYYASCDVFMIPRPPMRIGGDLIPMKFLEAMAMEQVLLVSDVPSMAQVINPGVNGITFRSGNADDFLARIHDLVDMSESQRIDMGKQARKDVIEHYSWEESRKQMQVAYSALTGQDD